jgi:hypothetical protein
LENTELLVENFNIELFEIITASLAPRCPGCRKQDKLRRIFFSKDPQKINGGYLTEEATVNINQSNLVSTTLAHEHEPGPQPFKPINNDTTIDSNLSSSVEYYFNFKPDNMANRDTACKAAEIFNKQSLYIDLELDCDGSENNDAIVEIDIYGAVTEPEICQ